MATPTISKDISEVLPETGISPGLIPVVREMPADLMTPVSVYLKLAGMGPSFLLESVTGGEQLARYSFIGVQPSRAYVFYEGVMEVHNMQGSGRQVQRQELSAGQDPLDALREVLHTGYSYPPVRLNADKSHPLAMKQSSVSAESIQGMPRFAGGLVGFLGYETVRYFEPVIGGKDHRGLQAHPVLPDAVFLLADTLVAFDHAFGRLLLIGNAYAGDQPNGLSLQEIEARLDEMERQLAAPLPDLIKSQGTEAASSTAAAHAYTCAKEQRSAEEQRSLEKYCQAVETAKEYIAAGDIFQVVLSQCLSRDTNAAPFDIYRSLRRSNPSPYMFYFDFADLVGSEPLRLIGASPEMHVRLEEQRAAIRPIAGTRPRGKTIKEDRCLEQELLDDPKELAEHVMLVDLARNDLGRICRYGSVRVSEQMIIERYSHVMHIASHVEGDLRPEFDAFDLLRATFPAGTVSGAPKIRAMQIIHQLEDRPRGPYAGAVGYFSYDGSMDTCITIRTMLMRGGTVFIQAGAGIVADSVPEREYQETLNKLSALAVAIDMAEQSTRVQERGAYGIEHRLEQRSAIESSDKVSTQEM